MSLEKLYDFAVVVTNDLNSDQRMHRICNYLNSKNQRLILIGHQKVSSHPIRAQSYSQKRLKTLFQKGPLFYLEFNIRLFLILMKKKVSKYYSVDLDTLLAIGVLSFIRRKPFVFDSHEFFSELPELANSPLKRFVWSALGYCFVKNAEVRYTVGRHLAEELRKKYNSQFIPLYNYPSLITYKKTTWTPESITILYQGKINLKRGIKEVVEAMNYLPDHYYLWIVGDGDLYSEVSEQIHSSEAKNRIKLIGWKNPSELKELTSRADLGLNLLSPESKNYYYSSANKVFDYVMAGVPCLTMNFPEYEDLDRRYDVLYLIESIDSQSIAQEIEKIFGDNESYLQKIVNCKTARIDLNWEREQSKLDCIL